MIRGANVVDASGHDLPDDLRDVLEGVTRGATVPPPATLGSDNGESWFFALVDAAEHHRLLGLLADELARSQWPLTSGMARTLHDRRMLWLTNSLHVERTALRVAELFGQHRVPHRFLKGVALAHVVYDDPATRAVADLDVLVPASHFDQAVALLAAETGADVPQPEPRPGFTRRFGKETVVRIGRIEVDVHRTLVAGPFAVTIDTTDLMAASTPFTLGDHTLHTLDAEGLVLHACCHVAVGDVPVRLGALHDLMRLAERLDWSAAAAASIAARWRIDAVTDRAVALADALLGLPADHPLLALRPHRVPRRQQLLLRSYLGPARGYTRELAAVAVVPGLGNRASYLRALLAPSPEYLHGRGRSRGGHLRNGLRRLLRRPA
jgi:hypothetical protein